MTEIKFRTWKERNIIWRNKEEKGEGNKEEKEEGNKEEKEERERIEKEGERRRQ